MKRIFIVILILVPVFMIYAGPGKKKFVFPSDYPDKTMIYVPSMAFNKYESYIGKDQEIHEGKTETVTIKGFYMSPYEVTNYEYLLFVNSCKLKWTSENNNQTDSLFNLILPDSLVWRTRLAYGEPFVEWYFRHPAYREYPVVGVSHRQCEKYCEWLTENYNSNEKRKYKKVKFRLPTENEWYAAAQYDIPDKKAGIPSVYSLMSNTKPFPWNGYRMINNEGKYKANFASINEASIFIFYDTIVKNNDTIIQKRYIADDGLGDNTMSGYSLYSGADITAPVKSYWPTGLGFYNLAGNVEEFVAEYGVSKGGSWKDPGYYLRNDVSQIYDATNEVTCKRGFRFVMDVIEEK